MPLDFCAMKGVEKDPYLPALWNAETVSFQIEQAIQNSDVYGTPWMAYPVSYKKMTAARDAARCQGVLRSTDPVSASINHMLSDVMTRWYVLSVQECAKAKAAIGTDSGFCPLMKKMEAEKYDTLSATMSTTAVYISSHIAISLSAIAFADRFWEAIPDTATHNDGRLPWEQVLAARVQAIKNFKPVFDRFNGFLADNLGTVAGALHEARLLNGDVLTFVSGISRVIPLKSYAFGKIRDEAFANALTLIAALSPADHPMIKVDGERYQMNYGNYNFAFVYPSSLRAAEEAALFAIANGPSREVYKRVLGGKSWEAVEKELQKKAP